MNGLGKVVKREWLLDAIPRVASAFRLYQEGCLPDSIEVFMVATPLKHALRGVYGRSNLGVAWLLLGQALREWFAARYWDFRWKVGWLNDDMREAMKDVEADKEV